MSSQRYSTRQRIIEAAQKLFISQGVNETTTRQIAELAHVNEVTLFRHFQNKDNLFLAVIEESQIFSNFKGDLLSSLDSITSQDALIREYAKLCLEKLEKFPYILSSLLGESRHYPIENRQVLGSRITEVNNYLTKYLEIRLDNYSLDAAKFSSMLNTILLGYATLELTSEFQEIWGSREEFLDSLVTLLLSPKNIVRDLPRDLVHQILQRARRMGKQEYALVYLLFASGISAREITTIKRSQYIHNEGEQFLQITQESPRQIPINQIILGKRYGSYRNNPLSRWLRIRKDEQTNLFTLSETEIKQIWQELTTGLITCNGYY